MCSDSFKIRVRIHDGPDTADLEALIMNGASEKTGLPHGQWQPVIGEILTRHLEILEKRSGTILKNAPETAVTLVKISELPVFCVKQFNDRGLAHRIKGLFRPTQGLRTFRNGFRLISNGILAAAPLALIRERIDGLVASEWVIMEFMENYLELDRYLVQKLDSGWSKNAQKSAVRQFGRFVGSMHSKGIFHSDLKTCNIMVCETVQADTESDAVSVPEAYDDSPSLRFCLLDYDDVSFSNHISIRKRVKNLVQIFLSTPSLVNKVERARFLDEYALHAGLSSLDRKKLAKEVLTKTQGKSILYVGFEGDVVETPDIK